MRQVVLLIAVAALGCEASPSGVDAGVSCSDRWSTALSSTVVEDLVLAGDRVVAVGRASDQGWVGSIDACGGDLIAEQRARPDGASTASLTAATRLGADVYAVGASDADGLLVRAGRDATIAYAVALGDPGTIEGFFDVVSAGGSLYAAGDADSVSGVPGLLVRVDAGGEACPMVVPDGLHARALAADDDRVHLVVSEGATVTLYRYSEAVCARARCACAPEASATVTLDVAEPVVTGLAVEGDTAWLGGYAIDTAGSGAAFVARVDLRSGVLEAVSRLDPTPAIDGFVDLAIDGDLILAVGASGFDGRPGFASARGVLAAFARDFADDAAPIVVLEPTGVRLVNAVVVDPVAPRFFLAGLAGEGSARVAMCTRAADGCEGTVTGAWPGGTGTPDGGLDGGVGEDAGIPAIDAGSGALGPPAIDPRDGRRFVRGGLPWYPTGYYPGSALNMTGPDYGGDHRAYNDALIDRLGSEGIDLFRVWINWGALTYTPASPEDRWDAHVLTPYARTGAGTAIDGQPRLDLDTWNDAYFAELERAVDRADAAGIVVQVLLLDCWHAGFGRSFGFEAYDYFAAGNNANGVSFDSEAAWADVDGPVYARNTAFVEEVVRRIGHHENLIWETCNEPRWIPPADPASVAAHPFHARLAARIHAVETAEGHPLHLVMPVDLPEHRSVAGHRTPADREAESVDAFRGVLVTAQHAWGLPLISDNDCCPGEPDATLLRRKAWAALTAGAHLDVFNNELFRRATLESMNTTLGMRWVALPGRLVRERGVDLATMIPCDATATPARWCYGHATGERVLYVEGGGPTTLSGVATPADAVWFDPRTGATTDAGDGPTFSAPDAQDWALHVR